MAMWTCFLWWMLLGGLLGWLANWLIGKMHETRTLIGEANDRYGEPMAAAAPARIVEKIVDNPQHLSEISRLNAEVASIATLKRQIAELESRGPQTIDRLVERPVEKIVEKVVDNPDHLAEISRLKAEVAGIAALKSRINELEARPPQIIEKIVERVVEKPGSGGSTAALAAASLAGAAVAKATDGGTQKDAGGQGSSGNVVKFAEVGGGAASSLEVKAASAAAADGAEVTAGVGDSAHGGSGIALDFAAAKAAGFNVKSAEDLEIIEGIGPKIARLLRGRGVSTFHHLAKMTPDQIRTSLKDDIPSYRPIDPDTWPEQAELAVNNKWLELADWQEELDGGVRRTPDSKPKAFIDRAAGAVASDGVIDIEAARAAGITVRGLDDIEIVDGIGEKVGDLLRAKGIGTLPILAQTQVSRLKDILRDAGTNFKMADPETWPKQAELAVKNDWAAFKALQHAIASGKA